MESKESVVTITINRKERLNALNRALIAQLADQLSHLSEDESVRCIVLAGAGGRAFSAGADISEFTKHRSSPSTARAYAQELGRLCQAISFCRHPVIVRIDGYCLGGGLVVACHADLRIASTGSTFGIPAAHLGASLGYTEIRPIMDLVGPSHTLALLLKGKSISAPQASRIGLINECIPARALTNHVGLTAQLIASGAPLVARQHRKFVRRLLDPRPIEPQEEDECFSTFSTDDYRAGWQAFLNKKPPAFTGR